MSALISSIEHSLAAAASDTVKVAKFVETKVLLVLKQAQAEAPTVEAVTSLVSPQAANIERVGFAVLCVVIKALDDAETATGASGLNVGLDAQLVADIKSIASTVKGAAPVTAATRAYITSSRWRARTSCGSKRPRTSARKAGAR